MTTFIDDAVITAVTTHMNDDHRDDSMLIARANGFPHVTAAVMTGLDEQGGTWQVTDADGEHTLTVSWPGGAVTERAQIRKAVVMQYRAACKTLGVAPREEHAAEEAHPHGAHPHGAHAHGSHPHGAHPHGARPMPEGDGFAHRIRTATWGDHSDSEGATFMSDLIRGKGTREDYTELSAQHYFMYEALEKASEQLLADPLLAALHPQQLRRMQSLAHDLAHLLGDDWRVQITPVRATAEYAARILEIAEQGWVGGIVAHHYTRYLGDLSGGQMIARRMAKQFGFDDAGVAFYDFTALGDLDAFKTAYRGVLDGFGERLDDEEQQRILDEVRVAYRFNTAVFLDLGADRAAA